MIGQAIQKFLRETGIEAEASEPDLHLISSELGHVLEASFKDYQPTDKFLQQHILAVYLNWKWEIQVPTLYKRRGSRQILATLEVWRARRTAKKAGV